MWFTIISFCVLHITQRLQSLFLTLTWNKASGSVFSIDRNNQANLKNPQTADNYLILYGKYLNWKLPD